MEKIISPGLELLPNIIEPKWNVNEQAMKDVNNFIRT